MIDDTWTFELLGGAFSPVVISVHICAGCKYMAGSSNIFHAKNIPCQNIGRLAPSTESLSLSSWWSIYSFVAVFYMQYTTGFVQCINKLFLLGTLITVILLCIE